MKPLRILVWDPSPSIRALVCRILSGLGGLKVDEATQPPGIDPGKGAIPDLMILGTGPQEPAGLPTASWIAEQSQRVVFLTPPGFLRTQDAAFPPFGGRASMLPKPSTPEGWDRLGPQLISLVLDMLAVRTYPDGATPATVPHRDNSALRRNYRLAAVGASSGGPAALHSLLSALKGRAWPGLAVVQHITPGFEEELVRWLARDLEMDVAVATDGDKLLAGTVRLAPPGVHLRIENERTLRLDQTRPPRGGHRPSVDELFFSIPSHWLPSTVAVLLDGMGRDGVEGLSRIREGGGMTIVQDPETCAVGGMPLAALRDGAAMQVLSPSDIGSLLGGGSGGGLP